MNKKRRNVRDNNEEIIKKIYKRSNPVRIKKDTYRPVRTGWLLVGFIFLFLVILLSFANTQILNAGKLKEIAVNQQLTKKSILAKRGNILDRNGEVLAQSIEVDTITANPKLLKNKKGEAVNKEEFAEAVSKIFDINKQELLNDLKSEKSVITIARKQEKEKIEQLKKYLDEKNIKKENVENFKMKIARGVEGEILGNKYFCGNEKYFRENNINVKDNIKEKIEKYSSEAKNIILFGDEKEVLSIVTLSDTLRENAKEMVENLKSFENEPLLLTGDNLLTAKYFSDKVGITEVKAELSPEEKFENIKNLKENNVVCMIGDGINDAPALKLADVSVAMGKTGSDISIESANIVLMGHDVSKIVYLKKLANATVKTIKFNIIISLLINFIAVILSVLGVLNPLVGAIVHNLGSILVILNASLLYDRKFN